MYDLYPLGGTGKKVQRRSSVQEEDSDDEEDNTWHYEGDKCDAPECKRPKSKKVSWVRTCRFSNAHYGIICWFALLDSCQEIKNDYLYMDNLVIVDMMLINKVLMEIFQKNMFICK
jgi:hypothetical protein